ncbi:sensor histidine kinase [Pseudarthrobacter sp. P1]|uniref:sensor histidine kinase n=1 Tax=Pseudarthrobacter sp. P1 TaxID=3418418 RepID=UPI003CF1F751
MSALDQPPTTSAAILRFLRVTLHVGFAVLLAVALVRLLSGGLMRPERYLLVAGALALATVYLLGTVAEKRFASGRSALDPSRYAVPWVAAVVLLWGLLLAGHAEFSWLAFPLFFLILHLLQRWVALMVVALMTAAVVWAQWSASGTALPETAAVVGPVLGAAFAVVTSQAYKLLYRESEGHRLAAEELRRTRSELAASQHEAGVLAERARLAREIHDTLAQGFSSIVLVSRAAEKSLAGGDIGSAVESLVMVRRTASENLAEARNFVRGLSSPLLEADGGGPEAETGAEAETGVKPAPEESAAEPAAAEPAPAKPAAVAPAASVVNPLVESLRRLCSKTELEAAARGVGLRCRFALAGAPVELPQPYQVMLLRAAQASLANVWVHAQASTAVVTLGFLDTEVTLDIYDDGVGFEPLGTAGGTIGDGPGAGDGSGFGLRSLRERVSAQQGSLAIESAPGEGTVVAIRLPLEAGPSGTEGAEDRG